MLLRKKIVPSLLISLLIYGCNNPGNNLNPEIFQTENNGINSFKQPVEGDESGGIPNVLPINPTIEKLPVLPAVQVFAAFNNDYRGLYSENEIIAHADPKNTDKYFYTLVKSAKSTLDAAIFDIDDLDAAKALIQAKKRGVKVRIVTDGQNLLNQVNPAQTRNATDSLKAAGIPVHDDGDRSAFMHNKFIVVDNKYVWTGSYNLTTNAMYRDNNNILLINSPALAANFNAEFKRLFEQGLFDVNPHEIPNPVVNLQDSSIKTYFSPGGGTKAAILAELKNASQSIKFMAFSFTDADMGNAIIEKSKLPGFQAEGVFDSCELSQYSVFNSLKADKIWVNGDGNQALMHHKTMIIDNTTVITGSFNFSKNAEESNNENTLIIKSPTLAKVYNAEYNRIKYASIHNTNLPDYDHPACKH